MDNKCPLRSRYGRCRYSSRLSRYLHRNGIADDYRVQHEKWKKENTPHPGYVLHKYHIDLLRAFEWYADTTHDFQFWSDHRSAFAGEYDCEIPLLSSDEIYAITANSVFPRHLC